jgi:hypothetical protein
MDGNIYKVLETVRKSKPKNKDIKKKSISQRIHAQRRFKERYSEELTTKDYDAMCRLVRNSKATFIEKQTNRVSRFKLSYKDKDIYFCYDKQRHTIVTFLKPEWVLDPGAHKESLESMANNELGV